MAFLAFLLGPIGRWLIVSALVAAAVFATYATVKGIGWDERDAIAREEAAEMQRLAAILAGKRREVTERVVIEYRDRVRVVQQQGEEVIREVEKLVPVDSCELPGGWRVLHDASATGRFPGAAERIDAAAVTAQDAARTVAENYATCRLDQERLTGLQAWVAGQSAVR